VTGARLERAQLLGLCRELDVDRITRDALVDEWERRPGHAWDDAVADVQAALVRRRPGDPDLPPPPAHAPLLHAHAVLGLVPDVVRRQAAMGIDAEVTRATLGDVANQFLLHQLVHGRPGLDKAAWLAHHLTDHLIALGRLQFQRSWFRWEGSPIPFGAPHLDVHVPEGGRLDSAAGQVGTAGCSCTAATSGVLAFSTVDQPARASHAMVSEAARDHRAYGRLPIGVPSDVIPSTAAK